MIAAAMMTATKVNHNLVLLTRITILMILPESTRIDLDQCWTLADVPPDLLEQFPPSAIISMTRLTTRAHVFGSNWESLSLQFKVPTSLHFACPSRLLTDHVWFLFEKF